MYRLDVTKQLVQVEAHYYGESNSWFALGFSDYGNTKLADYCLLWTDWRGQHHLQVAITTTTTTKILTFDYYHFHIFSRISGRARMDIWKSTLNKTATTLLGRNLEI